MRTQQERGKGRGREGRAHLVADELEARGGEELDELGVELLVGVPRPTGHLRWRLEVEEHVDLARGVLRRSSYRTG